MFRKKLSLVFGKAWRKSVRPSNEIGRPVNGGNARFGSVAALNCASKVTPLLLSIGVSSLATAVLPSFSRLSANQDWAGLRHTLNPMPA
jgi:hypothetical protein